MRDRQPPTIIVGTDFSPASRAAFDSGVRMAQEQGTRLVLVHAVRPFGAPGLELTRPDTSTFENETAVPATLGETGEGWLDEARSRGVDADVVVRPGLPAAVLVEEAERLRAKAVILGSSRKDGLEQTVLGSVAQAVKERTDRPVVVVSGFPEPDV